MRRAARWYDREASGLGGEFLAEVQRAFAAVRSRPRAGAPMPTGRRRVLLRRFPYAVVYRELPGALVRVLAVAHARRRPDYWAHRDGP